MSPYLLYLLYIAPVFFLILLIIYTVKGAAARMNKTAQPVADTEFLLATTDDCQLIQDLATEIWAEHFTPIIGKEQVAYMLELMYSPAQICKDITGGLEYYIIMQNRQAGGYFAIKNQSEKLFLNRIYIRKELRGQKIGKAAIDFIIDTARNRQQKCIYLTCNKKNTASISFYEKCGFSITDTKMQEIGNGFKMDDYILTLNL